MGVVHFERTHRTAGFDVFHLTNKLLLITMLNHFFLIVGMFLEPGAAIILLGPIFAPAMKTLGFDPLHFGIIIVFNMCIGLATPPFGIMPFRGMQLCTIIGQQMA
jgi:TRAP-type C4-dicarboxylate transport system permease large subunit